ncbi:sulfur oxidation c-type cytochrome SoxA [Acidithiobacillus sp. IBUN Pt1247-S3]|uniref:sulfur oxidation c-type cytochrome SoxA n=1 Tax=Acidithiobacillus sp. IBUN Pt1247-S3 TaxID=3166642 RepID=UPI0034E503DE
MKYAKRVLSLSLGLALCSAAISASAIDWWQLGNTKVGPQKTLQEFHQYFQEQFPKMSLAQYALGSYAFNKQAYQQYQEAMQFNPGDLTLAQGKKLWEAKFPDGKTYASCFSDGGKGVAAGFPYYDSKTHQVVTAAMRINACRSSNGLKPLKYGNSDLVALQTYFTSLSNGLPTNVKVEGAGAVAAFEEGKAYYFMHRGQLNFSCASCHVAYAGKYLRAQIISPLLGQSAHFPTYRSAWGAVNTLQKRFMGCDKKVGAAPQKLQSSEYRDLDYFMTYVSNGVKINVPGYRP